MVRSARLSRPDDVFIFRVISFNALGFFVCCLFFGGGGAGVSFWSRDFLSFVGNLGDLGGV